MLFCISFKQILLYDVKYQQRERACVKVHCPGQFFFFLFLLFCFFSLSDEDYDTLANECVLLVYFSFSVFPHLLLFYFCFSILPHLCLFLQTTISVSPLFPRDPFPPAYRFEIILEQMGAEDEQTNRRIDECSSKQG